MKFMTILLTSGFIFSSAFAREETEVSLSASAVCPTTVNYEEKVWKGEGNTIYVNPNGDRVSCHYVNEDEPDYKVIGVLETHEITKSLKDTKWILTSGKSEVAKTSSPVKVELSKIPKPSDSK